MYKYRSEFGLSGLGYCGNVAEEGKYLLLSEENTKMCTSGCIHIWKFDG